MNTEYERTVSTKLFYFLRVWKKKEKLEVYKQIYRRTDRDEGEVLCCPPLHAQWIFVTTQSVLVNLPFMISTLERGFVYMHKSCTFLS